MTTYFLVDNNVLNQLPRRARASAAFLARCRIPSEVVREARDADYADEVARLEVPMTIDALRQLKRVMASIPRGDRSLVDLFHNKGGADPTMIAHALALEGAQEGLWDDTWTVVTDDEAVIAKAREFGVSTLRTHEFVEEIRD